MIVMAQGPEERATFLEKCTVDHNFREKVEGVQYNQGAQVTSDRHDAQCDNDPCRDCSDPEDGSAGWCFSRVTPLLCTMDLVYTAVDWVFVLVLALAVLFIVLGAFQVVRSAGAAEQVEKGRDKLIYGIIAIAVAFAARGIIRLVELLVFR